MKTVYLHLECSIVVYSVLKVRSSFHFDNIKAIIEMVIGKTIARICKLRVVISVTNKKGLFQGLECSTSFLFRLDILTTINGKWKTYMTLIIERKKVKKSTYISTILVSWELSYWEKTGFNPFFKMAASAMGNRGRKLEVKFFLTYLFSTTYPKICFLLLHEFSNVCNDWTNFLY